MSEIVIAPAPTGPARTSVSPADHRLLGQVPLDDRAAVETALRAAAVAQPDWGARPAAERARVVERFMAVLVEDQDAVARLVTAEQGKPITEVLSLEILPTLAHLRWLVREGADRLAERALPLHHPFFAPKRGRLRYEPLGTVALITPFNYPLGIPAIQSAAALLAGNAVLLKPSPEVPLTAQKLAELWRRAALPADLFTVLHLADEDAPTLTAHPAVAKILFTGSVATGRRVMASAAAIPTPVVLELGGKDAAIVMADADLERAVAGIVWYGMANSGQSCAGVEQVFVHRDQYEAFVERAAAALAGLRVGDGATPGSEIGPLTNEAQLVRVEQQVEQAVAAGARLVAGGHRVGRTGHFYAPTLLVDVRPEMRLMQEESFGPILPVVPFDSADEAVEWINRAPFGLSASVWTRDERRGREIAAALRVGAVNINDHAFHFGEPAVAWRGLGQSGFGATHGERGLLELSHEKFVSFDPGTTPSEPWWYPYNPQVDHFLRNSARLLYGRPRRRPWALVSLLLNRRLRRAFHPGRWIRR